MGHNSIVEAAAGGGEALSDGGKPTVEADPDGAATVIYKTIARRIAVKIAEKAKDHTSKFPSIKVMNT